ncbi:MAG: sigma-E factor negative regulatory protein [Magnetococcales bacterium]|nr:sigma-E factor negative regulatory protein [Magnetococcales bacterium]
MSCNHEMISAYLDGELDAGLLDSVTSHLLNCPACCRQFSDLALARDAIQKNCLIPDPEGVISSVMAAIDQNKSHHPPPGKNRPGAMPVWTIKNNILHK